MAHKNITASNFQSDVLMSDKVVLVDFWAPWCGPCQILGPMIDQLGDELGDDVVVGKVNVDENGQIAAAYQIQGIPTVMIFKGGEVVERLVGVQPKQYYVEAVKEAKGE